MTYQIKFGTDGWREIIADGYTVENVKRVAMATAKWMQTIENNPVAVIGHDCRFGGEMFMKATACVFASQNIRSLVCRGFVTTPMVSLATNKTGSLCGIVITASHNPPSYNGFKIKASYGGPASPAEIEKIEMQIADTFETKLKHFDEYVAEGLIEYIDAEEMYLQHAEEHFDMHAIRNSGLNLAYDAMYGAGQAVMRRLLPDATFLHCDYNPGFDGQAPEPIHKNLTEFSEMIAMAENIDSGLATDGDADRIGLYNAKGEFIDSHHIILILIQYLYEFKGYRGKVVNSFSCSSRIKKLCAHYGLTQQTTKIGFKYICDIMVADDVLLGGEESGGIAIKGHIPERDGIWNGLVIWEYMAKSGKSLDDLIAGVYEITGSFSVDRDDLHIEESLKQQVIANCKQNSYQKFGNFGVESTENIDGYKFHLGNERWVMIRPSGTEPVLRVYAESESKEMTRNILDAAQKTIFG